MSIPLLIGLTGGIGSGKTVCAKVFQELNVPIYSSDDEAKRLMIEDQLVIEAIRKAFGNESYTQEGLINRKHLSNVIFNDRSKLNTMNSIVHPAVRQDFIRWAQEQQGHPYIMQESALLIEIGAQAFFNKIVLVDAPEDIRLRRVMERDDADEATVRARMSKQLSSEKKRAVADYIIDNDGQQGIIKQVIETHLAILNLRN